MELRQDWKKVTRRFDELYGKKVTPLFLKKKYKSIKEKFLPGMKPLTRTEDAIMVKVIEDNGLDWK